MDPFEVSNITSNAFNLTEYPECASGIKEGLEMVMNTTDYTKLTSNFNTCYPIQSEADVQDLYDTLEDSLRGLVMFNYPNESDFNVYLPPEPVRHFCEVFDSSKGTSFYKLAFGSIMFRQRDYEKGVYGCTDNAPKISSAWDALACNQIVEPIGSDKDSIFIEKKFDHDAYNEACLTEFGLIPNYNWGMDNFYAYKG